MWTLADSYANVGPQFALMMIGIAAIAGASAVACYWLYEKSRRR
jgi:hypothetical protein